MCVCVWVAGDRDLNPVRAADLKAPGVLLSIVKTRCSPGCLLIGSLACVPVKAVTFPGSCGSSVP